VSSKHNLLIRQEGVAMRQYIVSSKPDSLALTLYFISLCTETVVHLLAIQQHFDESIHATRKDIKALRAILKLLKPLLGDQYTIFNSLLKQTAHRLAPFRDQFILQQCWAKHSRKQGLKHFNTQVLATMDSVEVMLPETRQTLIYSLPELGSQLLSHSQRVSEVLMSSVLPGKWLKERFRLMIQRAKKIKEQVDQNDSVSLRHELRKRLKNVYYVLEMIKPVRTNRATRMHTELKWITEWLGDANDLHLLADLVASASFQDKDNVLELFCHEQRQLWKRSDQQLGRLFSGLRIRDLF